MQSLKMFAHVACALTLVGLAVVATAQPVRPPYGQAINLETAYEMMDNTQTASANAAVEKAKTSAGYRRTSKEFEDNVGSGRNAILGLPGVTPIEGGLPIVVEGKMIGAIGISGVTSTQDGQVAKAGVDALGK
jgi:uncharacterized protein GlcG (DUF336 family)